MYAALHFPAICSVFEFKSASINGQKFKFGIVSRRSRLRAGTRYFSRGINLEGDVSNFNETEMIMVTSSSPTKPNKGLIKASYVQTRGSVPIFWTEINNLRYRPDLKIMEIPQTVSDLRWFSSSQACTLIVLHVLGSLSFQQEALGKHFERQIELYGDQYIVNLVNSSGYEKAVKEAYEKGVRALGNPR